MKRAAHNNQNEDEYCMKQKARKYYSYEIVFHSRLDLACRILSSI